ncbi:MAG: DUF937 domain-containing protein [Bacteroidota bacterium]|nr:DUF937 domain-containing protein [Bacteroidota bacterium]
MKILEILSDTWGQEVVDGLAKETKQSEDKTGEILSLALPTLLIAMQKQILDKKDEAIWQKIFEISSSNKLTGNLYALFSKGYPKQLVEEGKKILILILGNKRENVAKAIEKQCKVLPQITLPIMEMATPLLMNLIREERKRHPSIGLNDVLEKFTYPTMPSHGQMANLFVDILNATREGHILDNLSEQLFSKSKSINQKDF